MPLEPGQESIAAADAEADVEEDTPAQALDGATEELVSRMVFAPQTFEALLIAPISLFR